MYTRSTTRPSVNPPLPSLPSKLDQLAHLLLLLLFFPLLLLSSIGRIDRVPRVLPRDVRQSQHVRAWVRVRGRGRIRLRHGWELGGFVEPGGLLVLLLSLLLDWRRGRSGGGGGGVFLLRRLLLLLSMRDRSRSRVDGLWRRDDDGGYRICRQRLSVPGSWRCVVIPRRGGVLIRSQRSRVGARVRV
jgi:hypothetical protein